MPDFGQIPSNDEPLLMWHAIELGETVNIDGRRLTALPANHTVPAIGYWLDSGESSLVFTGDTTTTDALWKVVNGIEDLRYLIIEAAWVAIRRDPALLMAYNELSQRMDNKKAIIRIAKKLLSRMRYVWMNNQPYECAVIE